MTAVGIGSIALLGRFLFFVFFYFNPVVSRNMRYNFCNHRPASLVFVPIMNNAFIIMRAVSEYTLRIKENLPLFFFSNNRYHLNNLTSFHFMHNFSSFDFSGKTVDKVEYQPDKQGLVDYIVVKFTDGKRLRIDAAKTGCLVGVWSDDSKGLESSSCLTWCSRKKFRNCRVKAGNSGKRWTFSVDFLEERHP